MKKTNGQKIIEGYDGSIEKGDYFYVYIKKGVYSYIIIKGRPTVGSAFIRYLGEDADESVGMATLRRLIRYKIPASNVARIVQLKLAGLSLG